MLGLPARRPADGCLPARCLLSFCTCIVWLFACWPRWLLESGAACKCGVVLSPPRVLASVQLRWCRVRRLARQLAAAAVAVAAHLPEATGGQLGWQLGDSRANGQQLRQATGCGVCPPALSSRTPSAQHGRLCCPGRLEILRHALQGGICSGWRSGSACCMQPAAAAAHSSRGTRCRARMAGSIRRAAILAASLLRLYCLSFAHVAAAEACCPTAPTRPAAGAEAAGCQGGCAGQGRGGRQQGQEEVQEVSGARERTVAPHAPAVMHPR